MEKKWRVRVNIELLEGGLLFGFALYDQHGPAVPVSLGYQTEAKKLMRAVVP